MPTGKDFDKGFAGGGSLDAAHPVADAATPVHIASIGLDQGDVQLYLNSHADSEVILRVTFDLAADPYSPYKNARFGILTSDDGKARVFLGFYETDAGGLVPLIKITLAGQSVGAIARAINAFSVARAEVLNNRYSLSSDCLDDSPFQNGTNVWSLFYRKSGCGDISSPAVTNLKNDIKLYFTSIEPNLEQNIPKQSLGGYVSPTQIYDTAELQEPLSFYNTVVYLDDDNLASFSILQIGDELMTVKEWKNSSAVIDSRNAFGTPIRFHPRGSLVRGIVKNDIFDRILNKNKKQYRCIAIRNTSSTETARNVKVFFKLDSRNILSKTRFAIEIPRSEYYTGNVSLGGSTTTFTDSSLAEKFANGHFISAAITFSSGLDNNQTRIINQYEGKTGKFTVSEELPYKVKSGDIFFVDTSPSQIISSGLIQPSIAVYGGNSIPYLVSDFQSATFANNGVGINIAEQRSSNGDLKPGETIFVWLERQIDDNNDEFENSRSIISISFNRA